MGLRMVMGVVGDVFAGARFLVPMITFWDIFKKKEVGQRSVIPYGLTWCNCVAWILYSLPMSSWLVAGVNLGGLLIVPVYFFIYFYYSAGQARSTSWWVLAYQVFWDLLLVIVHFTLFNGQDHEREVTFGFLGALTASAMYLSAFIDMYTVFWTEDVKNMSLLFVLVSLCNSVAWTVYASVNNDSVNTDVYILVPNSIGIVVTVIQVVVWVFINYKAKRAAEAPHAEAPPAEDIELPVV
ncbi:bidirectional sugar transporter SWEET6b-like [Brachypodium distachyon]|uniref:bidirectional sugar transporter SWEET6b-like n=1 Tax=Brachypodium distachyon TaxID=15368 RepID=UPI00053008CF|nr:bidirectional sugar transporter SWEET6b-like [Brachypodium distachyon]|eukprot:XP_010233604.1 bidirectional sugar transporter SWEET6b-like [Brachypodium distachyon]